MFVFLTAVLLFACSGPTPATTADAATAIPKSSIQTEEATAAQEVSCTCSGKTVTKTCADDGYCDCSGSEPKVVCCSGSCTD